ncbi:MAG: YceI family protein [Acidobacteriota bacterium]|nr:YceI family protein [Acidobacteriota bacterium]MDH3783829.1 YceI family protein [Acidobacteriota bacterium]
MKKTIPAYGLWCFGLTMLVLSGVGCSNPASNAPDAEVGDAVSVSDSNRGEAPTGFTYVIDETSTIEFVGAKVTGIHDGGFDSFDGSIKLIADDPTQSSIELNIDATSIWTDNEKLTGHLKSPDFFEVETYPTAVFQSTSIVAAEDGGFDVTGNLNLHGVEKSITFPATIVLGHGTVTATAEFSIKRFDFGIVYPGAKDNLIKDEVLIRFNLTATPAT